MRDARINLIFEGTNEILRCFVALSGIKGPSEHMKELGRIADISTALQAPIKSLGVFTQFAKRRLSKMILSRVLTKHHPKLQEASDHFSSLLSAFSIQVEDVLIKYGKSIIDNQLPQKRIANMAIQLLVMLAVISRTTKILEDEKIDKKDKDYCLNLANYSTRLCRHRFMANLKEISKNIDRETISLSKEMSRRKGHGLDILRF